MTNSVIAADLCKLAVALKNSGAYRRFEDAVYRYDAIVGALRDLGAALDALRYVDNLTKTCTTADIKQDPTEALIGKALFFQAIMFYGRATQTDSKGRRGSGIHQKLKGDWRRLHDRAFDLRNKALAHVDGGGEDWAQSTVVARFSPPYIRILTPHKSYNYRATRRKNTLACLKKASL